MEVAQRLADAEDFADQVQRRLRPANTTDMYAKAWKVGTRFCAAQGFPEPEATRGALVAFVVWLLDRGRVLVGGRRARVRRRRPARNVTGGMVPDSVTRAVKRISARAGTPLAWTGHSLRIGLATTARKKGKDAVAIADQGGWARHSRSTNGYFQRVDGWEDNATAGLT
ncbi:hypothetical protein ACUJ8N_05665 [Streptomyces sp. ESR1.13]|uniref:hypothetical protein n=1 Tax=unclassified Streptomyces TaxID=2593676 RepID=UPI00404230DC